MSSSSGESADADLDEQTSHIETDSSDPSDLSPQEHAQGKGVSARRQRPTLTDAVSKILKKKTSEEAKESKVLSRRKAPERKLAEAKLEAAARRLLRAERLVHQDLAHITINLDPGQERRLRKTATGGVVQIFNVIKQKIQAREQQEVEKRAKKIAALSAARKQQGEQVPSKEQGLQMSFLELLKTNMANK